MRVLQQRAKARRNSRTILAENDRHGNGQNCCVLSLHLFLGPSHGCERFPPAGRGNGGESLFCFLAPPRPYLFGPIDPRGSRDIRCSGVVAANRWPPQTPLPADSALDLSRRLL
jgi:hypothetical protein